MTKKCLKCGYERQSSDVAPDYECPKCGAVYAKVESHLASNQQTSSENKETKQCPYCGEEILLVAIKCKHCGSMLEDEPSLKKSNKAQEKKAAASTKELSSKQIMGLLMVGLLTIGLIASGSFATLWAHLISPFDSKPKINIADLVDNPKILQKKKAELCSWSKREELRNPSRYNAAAREIACKDIK